ncbi:MAG: FkbM family methyltransferase [Chloroflexi bacterium]|nr:FkbM family methyltransferase [Chloroflexota bacterium]
MTLRSLLKINLQYIYYSVMMPYWQSRFSPYIGDVTIGDVSFRFFYGTQLSHSWYHPIKDHALAEYLWVQRNLNLKNQNIIDAGAHHGHYSTYFAALGGSVTAVEPLPGNVTLLTVNAAINKFDIKVVQSAISDKAGISTFIPRSNGKMFKGVGITVPVTTLPEIDSSATIVKLDVEGAEFQILPAAIDMMPKIVAWIIEAHSQHGDINTLAVEFKNRGFEVNYLEKNSNKVLPFNLAEKIFQTTTIFCVK